MKKSLITLMLLLIKLIPIKNVSATSTIISKEKIDITRDCSLTLEYNYDEEQLDNINLKIYYIASVTEDYQYELSSNFSNYPVKINGIKTTDEWTTLESTLNAYIIADAIEANLSISNQKNKLVIQNLKPGLYFIQTKKIKTETATMIFDSFLIQLPNLTQTGDWDYNVYAYPKIEEYIPTQDKTTYTIMKQWKDNIKTRPDSIKIKIYQDGVFIEDQTLSKKNNWMYQFEATDDGNNWSVIEENIPTGYQVSIYQDKNNFIIVNTLNNYQKDNPKTLDNIKFYLFSLILSILGIILLIISIIFKKRR